MLTPMTYQVVSTSKTFKVVSISKTFKVISVFKDIQGKACISAKQSIVTQHNIKANYNSMNSLQRTDNILGLGLCELLYLNPAQIIVNYH